MRAGHVRPFTSRDALVLIVATAVGFAGVRAVWPLVERNFSVRVEGRTASSLVHDAPHVLRWFLPCVVAWTLATLGLRLLPPRPSLRRLTCQPGAVACGAVAFTLAWKLLGHLASYAVILLQGQTWRGADFDPRLGSAFPEFTRQALRHVISSSAPVSAACAITTGWALLIVGRRWRPEASWIDRTGVALGVLWLVLCACYWWCTTITYLFGDP